jgi:hypothetical protein
VDQLNLMERALRLKYNTGAALDTGAARFLPAVVVALIQEQAEIIALLAHDLRRVESLIDIGGDDGEA